MKNSFISLAVVFTSFILIWNGGKVQAPVGHYEHIGAITGKPFDDGFIPGESLPLFNKIVIIIGENTSANSVGGNKRHAPFINFLLENGAYFAQSFSLFHPSQPNYLALFSGSDQGISDDATPANPFNTPNLARELLNTGKSFISYSEDLPTPGFNGNSSGLYVRKHNAVANWIGEGKNQVPPAVNQPFTSFPSDFSLLPDVSFVIPNICNGGHNPCEPYKNRILQFDKWLQKHFDAYKNWCQSHNSLLIVTYDEDDYTGNNSILTVFYGYRVKVGKYRKVINAYSILRTIEDCMGLTEHAGNAAKTAPITYCWTPVPK